MSDIEKWKQKQVFATARVQVTVEVILHQPWGGDCSIAQLFAQAEDSAVNRVRQVVEQGSRGGDPVRVLGEPKVTMVSSEEKRS